MNVPAVKTLETSRLLLRKFKTTDASAMFENWAGDPNVTRFLSWPPHESETESSKILHEWTEGYSNGSLCNWAITLKSDDAPIGSIGIVSFDNEDLTAEVGYCIGEDWWNRGFTSEALAEVMRYLFLEGVVARVTSKHDPLNPASGAVMQKCGMSLQGVDTQDCTSNLRTCRCNVYAIGRNDYLARIS